MPLLEVIGAAGVTTMGVDASVLANNTETPYSNTAKAQEVHFQELAFILMF